MDVFDRERKAVVDGVAVALRKAFEFFRVSPVSTTFANEGKVMPSVASEEDIADYILPMVQRAEMDSAVVVCAECKYYGKNRCYSCIRKNVWMTDNYEPKEGERQGGATE